MSFALSIYLVDIAKVQSAVGSGDEKLRRMIGGRFKRELARADEWFEDQIADGAPTRYDALRAVIDGGPFDAAYAFQYGYAYQMICEFHGKALYNNDFSPFRSGWLEQVDEALGQLGVKAVSVSEFMYHSLPPALPAPEEFPGYGEWSPSQCQEALAQWEATTPAQRATVAPEALRAIESCVDWLRAAQAKDGYGIAGFFH